MRILSIDYLNQDNYTNFDSLQYGPRPDNTSFEGGLTRLVKKSPSVSHDLLRLANSFYKRDNGFVGAFPSEFIIAIKKNLGTSNPERIKECISSAKEEFGEAVKILGQVEESKLEKQKKAIQTMSFNQIINNLAQRAKGCIFFIFAKSTKNIRKQQNRFLPDPELILSIEQQASKVLEEGLKKNKVIFEDSKVIIKRLDDGRFGTIYKISFIDANNNNIFDEKVIKCYKSVEEAGNIELEAAVKQFRLIKENYKKYMLFAKSIFEPLAIMEKIINKFSHNPFHGLEKYKCTFITDVKSASKQTVEQYKKSLHRKIKLDIKETELTQGINKEANIGNYIKNASGPNLDNSDLITYYYTDLNNNYALLNFSDYKVLGPVTKKNDYEALGIIPKDTVEVSKLTNFVDGRLIDYGGFEVTNKILSENPVARRIYKKIKHIQGKDAERVMQQRIDMFNDLYIKAASNKLPQSKDVLLGLKEAKKLILKSKYGLLSDANV